MSRCASRSLLALACAGRLRGLIAPLVATALLSPALGQAQTVVTRTFPADALRTSLVLTSPSEALLNGKAVGLAPGLRIRDANNMLVLSGALIGQKATVHYTLDFLDQVKDVWILRPDELARYWPRNAAEAAERQFDPAAQTWTRP